MAQHLVLDPTTGDVLDAPRASTYRVHVEGREFAISPEGFKTIAADRAARQTFIDAATTFHGFIDAWSFRDGETGATRVLGESIWDGQREYADALEASPWTFLLKARQIGATTIAICYAAWVARFRDANARVHALSHGDDAAQELLSQIRFGLEELPPVLALPIEYTAHTVRLGGSLVKSYPSTPRSASRGTTASHLLLDEWAAMVDSRRTYQAAAPTVSPQGSFSILTTAQGAASYSSLYFRRCMSNQGKHKPVFVSSIGTRPDRSESWYAAMETEVDSRTLRQEYPRSWEEALSSGGEYAFTSESLDIAVREAYGFAEPKPKHRYAVGVDLGKTDASVVTVLDITVPPFDVVHFRYLKGLNYVVVGSMIEQVHREYNNAIVVVEKNSIGDPVCDALNIPYVPFTTSRPSKTRIIQALAVALQRHEIKWIPEQCPELDAEMRGYQWEDQNIPQDCVMSLAFAYEAASHPPAPQPGRMLQPFLVG